jgi:hypothetical protein
MDNGVMEISGEISDKLLHLLRGCLQDKQECKAYLIRALGTEIVDKFTFNWDKPLNILIPMLLKKLAAFGEISPGEPALFAYLNIIREAVGYDIQLNIDDIIVNIEYERKLSADKMPPYLLFDLLLTLDFKRQVSFVRQVMQSHQAAAFLVHGDSCCGQDILVNRLFRLKRKWKNIAPIKINVSCNGIGTHSSRLWRQLTSWFNLPKNAQSGEIIGKICDRFLNQDIIFIFDTVDYMPSTVLIEWLHEFWQNLVYEILDQNQSITKDQHLLMFLVDNSGSVGQSLAKEFEQSQYPSIIPSLQPVRPFSLEPVRPFSLEIVDDWMSDVMVNRDVQFPDALTAEILLENSENGIPQFVYEEICYHCGYDWEGDLAKWLI